MLLSQGKNNYWRWIYANYFDLIVVLHISFIFAWAHWILFHFYIFINFFCSFYTLTDISPPSFSSCSLQPRNIFRNILNKNKKKLYVYHVKTVKDIHTSLITWLSNGGHCFRVSTHQWKYHGNHMLTVSTAYSSLIKG